MRFLLLFLLLLLPSCVYFNTFYNAKKYFRQAEKARLEEESREKREGNQPRRPGRGQAVGRSEEFYEKAARKASKVVEEHEESDLVDDAFFLMGQALYWRRDYLYATRAFTDLINHFPDSPYYDQARYWRALSTQAQGVKGEARRLYRELFSEKKEEVSARAGLQLGEMAFEEEDYGAAIQEYKATLETFPKIHLRAQLWLRLGEAALRMEVDARYGEAMAAFDRVQKKSQPPKRNIGRA